MPDSDYPMALDQVEAMCQVPSCSHREPISLDAWLRGENFEHCGIGMRVHVPSQEFAAAAIERAMEEGISPNLIVARLSAGITDINANTLVTPAPRKPNLEADVEPLKQQLVEQLIGEGIAGKGAGHTIGAAPVTPLTRWAASTSLRLSNELAGEQYSVVVTVGPAAAGDEAIAITAVNHGDEGAHIMRGVYRPPAEPTDAWIAKRVSRLVAALFDL